MEFDPDPNATWCYAHVEFLTPGDASNVIEMSRRGELFFRGRNIQATPDRNPPPDGVSVPVGSGALVSGQQRAAPGGPPGGSPGVPQMQMMQQRGGGGPTGPGYQQGPPMQNGPGGGVYSSYGPPNIGQGGGGMGMGSPQQQYPRGGGGRGGGGVRGRGGGNRRDRPY